MIRIVIMPVSTQIRQMQMGALTLRLGVFSSLPQGDGSYSLEVL